MSKTSKQMVRAFVSATLVTAGACAGPASTASGEGAFDYEGIPELYQPLTEYSGTCVFNAATKAVTVDDGGTAQLVVLSKRSVDSALLLNGYPCALDNLGVPIKTTVVKTIDVSGANGTTLIVDFLNGTFALGTGTVAAPVPGITASIGTSNSAFKLRGTTGVDTLMLMEEAGGGLGISVTGLKVDIVVDGLTAAAGPPRTVEPALTFSLAGGNDIVRAGPTGGAGTTLLQDVMDPFNVGWVANIYGGEGNDTFHMGADIKGDLIISGGPGTDTVSYAERGDASDGTVEVLNVSVDGTRNDGDMTDSVADDREKDNILVDNEVVVGGFGNDVLKPGDTKMDGTARDASDAALTLNGGPGDDYFVETDGAAVPSFKTVFIGGTGTDTVVYSQRSNALTVTMGLGADDGETAELDDVQLTVENVVGGTGDDALTGSASDNVICGSGGDDDLSGGLGNDTFPAVMIAPEGTAFDPEWTGTTTTDAYVCEEAAAATDSFDGGAGVDHLDFSGLGESFYDAAGNNVGGSSAVGVVGVTADLSSDSSIEMLTGSTGNDTLTGNALDNLINGGGGVDDIDAGAGNDTIEVADALSTCECGDGADLTIGCNEADPALYLNCEG